MIDMKFHRRITFYGKMQNITLGKTNRNVLMERYIKMFSDGAPLNTTELTDNGYFRDSERVEARY